LPDRRRDGGRGNRLTAAKYAHGGVFDGSGEEVKTRAALLRIVQAHCKRHFNKSRKSAAKSRF
jgi:hypothetical protein